MKLESTIAGAPRIAVGRTCVDYLDGQIRRNDVATDVRAQLAAMTATWCRSMVRVDADGVVMLDALGEGMRELANTATELGGQSISEPVPLAHQFVRDELRRSKEGGDEKLIARYQLLLSYFDDRAPQWS